MGKQPAIASPDLELIVRRPRESFRWNVHDYPHDLARWHYHPEYELHLIQESSGTMFVGDYVGGFRPGVLVLTGPNLPHNWVSDIRAGDRVRDRDMLVQFGEAFIRGAMALCPELQSIAPLLEDARHGVVFRGRTAECGARDLRRIGATTAARRLALFFALLDDLSRSDERTILSSPGYAPSLNHAASETIGKVIGFLSQNLTGPIHLSDASGLCGMSDTVFSRFFKRHTGHSFNRYLNRMRVNRACELLTRTELPVTDICFETGFSNISDFNRQFRKICAMTPTDYRREARRNLRRSTDLHRRLDEAPASALAATFA